MAGQQPNRRNGRRSKGDKALLEGRYMNYVKVGHNAFEFNFDFGQYHPEVRQAQFHTRIVTVPIYAKLLADMLSSAIKQFEAEYGAISNPD
jgi:hypothetical protein